MCSSNLHGTQVRETMFVQMCHDIRAYYVFKQLARYTSQGDYVRPNVA